MKYKLTDKTKTLETGKVLYQIQALKNFGTIKINQLGGFVQHTNNLSQNGTCWVFDNAMVFDNAKVFDSAMVHGNAKVFGNAKVYGYAQVFENAQVFNYGQIYENAMVCGNVKIFGLAKIYGYSLIMFDSTIGGHVELWGYFKTVESVNLTGTIKQSHLVKIDKTIGN